MPSSPGTDRRDTASGAPPVEQAEAPERREPSQAEHEAEIARLEDRYKRALADLDNYRKRSARDVERGVQEVRGRLISDWLDVVDSVERAMRMDPAGNEGLQSVLEQMRAVLARQGARRFGEPGERFDPERHEAIAVRQTDEVPEGTIQEVVRSGYELDGRVLRPAQVIVSKWPWPDGPAVT